MASNTNQNALRDSRWAMELLGYAPGRRSAFWQFVVSNDLPRVKTGKRKVQFVESVLLDWVAQRSIGRGSA